MRYFSSRNDGITGYLAHHNLAAVYTGLADLKRAETEWRHVVTLKPHYRAGWRGLADNLLQQGKIHELDTVIASLRANPLLKTEAAIIAARQRAVLGDVQGARALLDEALQLHDDDPAPLDALCQLLFEYGDPKEAEAMLKEKVRRDPTDGAAYHNLGTVNRLMGRSEDAINYYLQSLLRRPNSPRTYVELALAWEGSGHPREALTALEHARELNPHDEQVAAMLEKLTNSKT